MPYLFPEAVAPRVWVDVTASSNWKRVVVENGLYIESVRKTINLPLAYMLLLVSLAVVIDGCHWSP